MLRVIAVIGATTYYFSSEPLDYDDRYWEPRISNDFEITRSFEMSEKTGNRIRSMDLTLDNRDGYFNSIESATGFLNMKVTFLFNEGTANYQKFTGKINKINSYGDDISLTVMETGYEYLKDRIPDAQIAYDYYSTSGINNSWNAIPIPFGTVNRIPLAWVNLFRSEFIIGSGPLFKVSKIYFEKVVVYDESTGQNIYRPTPESDEIKIRVFKGTGSIGSPETVDGVESEYPGFAYVQLYKVVDGVEEPADPITPDGETAQLYADIEGIVNATGTAAERNPAQILYNLMTKPTTLYEGYGLGLPTADLDFATAILECDVQGFKIDGVIDNTTEFEAWMNEILRCCRGHICEEGGKIKLTIDAQKTAASITFDEAGETGLNCIVGTWDEPDLESQINRLRLSYSWNFENNDFNKKPGVHEESPLEDPNLRDEAHATRIMKWNTDVLEFKLIKDDDTAHKLAQYYLKKVTKQLKKTSLVTEVDIGALDAGHVIELTSAKYGWISKEFTITSIERSQTQTKINLQEYSDDVYVYVSPGTAPEDAGQGYSIYNIPNKPVMTSFEVVNEILKDGTVQSRIDVSYTKPLTNVQMVALYYKLNGEPDNTFKPLDFTVGESEISAVWKGKEDGDYNFRLVSISPVGIYSDISIVAGDQHYYGHPDVESYVTLEGDTEAPGTPIISTIQPILAGVSIYLDITGGFPDDFSHFIIKRKIGENIVTLDNNYPGQLFSDISYSEAYLARSYAVISVDRTGNESEQSAWSIEVTPLQINTDDLSFGSITTDLITNFQIIGKDFRTSCDTGPTVDGVLFNFDGIQAWYDGVKTVEISASTGAFMAIKGTIGGWNIYETTISANNLVLNSDGSIHNAGFVAGTSGIILDESGLNLWNNSVNTFSLDSSTGDIHVIGGNFETTSDVGETGNGIKLSSESFEAWNDAFQTFYLNASTGEIDLMRGWVGGWSLRDDAIYSDGIKLIKDHSLSDDKFVDGVGGWSALSTGAFKSYESEIRGILTGINIKNKSSISGNIILKPSALVDNRSGYVPAISKENYTQVGAEEIFETYIEQIQLMTNTTFIPVDFDDLTYEEFVELDKEYYYLIMNMLGNDSYEDTSDEDEIKIYIKDGFDNLAQNDIVNISNDTLEFWGRIDELSTDDYGDYLFITILNGEKFDLTSGQVIINYGNSTNGGGVLFDGAGQNISVFTHDGTPWAGLDVQTLIGNLNGWGSFGDVFGIAIGTSTGNYLTYDSSSELLNFKGNVKSGSTGIANFSDAGLLATADDLDDVQNGETYAKTTYNQVIGAARAYEALDSAYDLITSVKPTHNIGNPSASGLYVGADKLGYFDTCTLWKSYIDNSGNFYLVSNEDYLTFINNKINIAGSFVGYGELLDGYIGDLQITTEGINSPYADADGIYSLIIKGYRPEIRLKHEYYSQNYSCYSCDCNYLELELTEIILNPYNTGIVAENSPVRINVATNDRTALFTNGNIVSNNIEQLEQRILVLENIISGLI